MIIIFETGPIDQNNRKNKNRMTKNVWPYDQKIKKTDDWIIIYQKLGNNALASTLYQKNWQIPKIQI